MRQESLCAADPVVAGGLSGAAGLPYERRGGSSGRPAQAGQANAETSKVAG